MTIPAMNNANPTRQIEQIQSVLLPFLYLFFPNIAQFLGPCIKLFAVRRRILFLITGAALTTIPQVRRSLLRTVLNNTLVSNLVIPSHDLSYDMLAAFMLSRDLTLKADSVAASTGHTRGIQHQKATTSQKPLYYYPHHADFIFWYRRQPFRFRCQEYRDGRLEVVLSAFSGHALRNLLENCRTMYYEQQEKSVSWFEHCTDYWVLFGNTVARPLKTVVMSHKVKDMLLADVQEFLSPCTQQWYAQAGHPYRRGYLLHGQPGTGKTSLILSIAGEFSLDLYFLKLSTVQESDLSRLFFALPARCIVVIEDVDAFSHHRQAADQMPHASIAEIPSLSGLLNVIDGIGSAEGRILFMTTNHKDKLDDALLRHGRVDLQVEMELCSKIMLEELFLNIFTPLTDHVGCDQPETMKQIAATFASNVPENTFSPATVTSILVRHRKQDNISIAVAKHLANLVNEAN